MDSKLVDLDNIIPQNTNQQSAYQQNNYYQGNSSKNKL